MSYRRFLSFNVIGGISWVTLFLSIGYFFGNLPFIKSHFSMVVFAIIFISVLPVMHTVLVSKMKKTQIDSANSLWDKPLKRDDIHGQLMYKSIILL